MKRIILIGEITSYKAIVISKFIKKHYHDVVIYSYDNRKFSKYFYSKYIDKHFLVSKDHFENDLIQLILAHKIDYFFPVINDSLSKLWRKKEEFNHTLDYLGNVESYKVLNDKDLLYQLAMQLGIRVPVKYNSIIDAKIPYVVKPINLSSAKGVIYVKSEKDIPDNIKYENIIIQQYIQGVGVGYSFYCKNGKILESYGHKRLAEYPVTGGSSTYREEYINSKMIEIASKIVGHLNYTGFAMFEFKLTPTNELFLIEVNPRIWGSINQGLINGVNYFENILGKPDKPVVKGNGEIRTYLSPLFYLSLIKYVFKLSFKPLFYFIKYFNNSQPDVNFFNDPKGYISFLLRKVF